MPVDKYRGTPLTPAEVCGLLLGTYIPGLKLRLQNLAISMRVQLVGKGNNELHPLVTIWLTVGEMEAYLRRANSNRPEPEGEAE
jgi:hypothetical protein